MVSGDIACTSPITIERSLTLVVDGTLKNDGDETIFVSSGTLTLSGRGTTSIIESQSDYRATVRVYPNANIVLDGATIKSSKGYGIWLGNTGFYTEVQPSSLIMYGGTIESVYSAVLVGKNSKVEIIDGNLTSSSNVIQSLLNCAVTIHITGGVFTAKTDVPGKAVCGILANSDTAWYVENADFNITNGIPIVASSGNIHIQTNRYYIDNSNFSGGVIDSFSEIQNVIGAVVVSRSASGLSGGLIFFNSSASYEIEPFTTYYSANGTIVHKSTS